MNIGTVFQEDGLYKIIFKLGVDGWPHVRKFSSFEDMLKALQLTDLPFDELAKFVSFGLESKGKLTELPGKTASWGQFAR